jgi:hypothetical protein
MPLFWRIWLVVSALIALVLAVLTVLGVLQFEAILSALIRGRLEILAQTTQASFRSALALGLPLETIRNARAILEHAKASDPAITAIHVFEPSGAIVHSTMPDPPASVRAEALFAQAAAGGTRWSVETESELLSGVKILDPMGAEIGGLVVVYPVTDIDVAANAMTRRLGVLAVAIAVLGAAAALAAVRTGLGPALRSLTRLDGMMARLEPRAGGPPQHVRAAGAGAAPAAFVDISEIELKLAAATASFQEAETSLAALEKSWNGARRDPADR